MGQTHSLCCVATTTTDEALHHTNSDTTGNGDQMIDNNSFSVVYDRTKVVALRRGRRHSRSSLATQETRSVAHSMSSRYRSVNEITTVSVSHGQSRVNTTHSTPSTILHEHPHESTADDLDSFSGSYTPLSLPSHYEELFVEERRRGASCSLKVRPTPAGNAPSSGCVPGCDSSPNRSGMGALPEDDFLSFNDDSAVGEDHNPLSPPGRDCFDDDELSEDNNDHSI